MKILRYSLLIASALAALPAWGTTCITPYPEIRRLEAAISYYDAIFIGQVVKQEKHVKSVQWLKNDEQKYTIRFRSETNTITHFNVTRTWKNPESANRIEVVGEKVRDFVYEMGGTYVVFATKEKGTYRSPVCSPTALVGESEELIESLDELENRES